MEELRIKLVEEWGYRTWIWCYPGTREALIQDWLAGRAPLNFYDPSFGDFPGRLFRVTQENQDELLKVTPGFDAHVHTESDTYLRVEETQYPGTPSYQEPPTTPRAGR
jgi:hypothetical protein